MQRKEFNEGLEFVISSYPTFKAPPGMAEVWFQTITERGCEETDFLSACGNAPQIHTHFPSLAELILLINAERTIRLEEQRKKQKADEERYRRQNPYEFMETAKTSLAKSFVENIKNFLSGKIDKKVWATKQLELSKKLPEWDERYSPSINNWKHIKNELQMALLNQTEPKETVKNG